MNNNKHTVYLVRHAQVDGPAALYGHTDVDTTEKGKTDIAMALDYCANQAQINYVFSSPLKRCATAASDFCQQHQHKFELMGEFKEMNFGEFDGVPFDELYQANGDVSWQALECFWSSPEKMEFNRGENLVDFYQRVSSAWQVLIELISQIKCRDIDAKQASILVCHGGVIRMVLSHLLDIDWRNPKLFQQLDIRYASVTEIELNLNYLEHVKVKSIGRQCP
ncbi:histidine phosphatase family protein [Catenovulum sp. SM1970]|uniref:histidine phosphatase family protein n=1 Tax=Marinifaba aquimaris TaxID=2741323 RepID=UPI001571DF3A|nr:histidine phosphatase family protein [Marinifaba aquimaris]NTS77769.1 histidine phosphatase family protein [Marinifaba aquimaris]